MLSLTWLLIWTCTNRRCLVAVSIVRSLIVSSRKGWDDAVEQGLARATKTVRGITEIEVISERVRVEEGSICDFQVKLKIRFVLDED